MTAAYARRPARTSQRYHERIRKLHVRARGNGVTRTISLLDDGARSPVIAIAHWRDGMQHGRIMIFTDHVDLVARAIELARAGARRRVDAGAIECGQTRILIWAESGAIHFGRVRTTDGERLGVATVLEDTEVDALATGLSILRGHEGQGEHQ